MWFVWSDEPVNRSNSYSRPTTKINLHSASFFRLSRRRRRRRRGGGRKRRYDTAAVEIKHKCLVRLREQVTFVT